MRNTRAAFGTPDTTEGKAGVTKTSFVSPDRPAAETSSAVSYPSKNFPILVSERFAESSAEFPRAEAIDVMSTHQLVLCASQYSTPKLTFQGSRSVDACLPPALKRRKNYRPEQEISEEISFSSGARRSLWPAFEREARSSGLLLEEHGVLPSNKTDGSDESSTTTNELVSSEEAFPPDFTRAVRVQPICLDRKGPEEGKQGCTVASSTENLVMHCYEASSKWQPASSPCPPHWQSSLPSETGAYLSNSYLPPTSEFGRQEAGQQGVDGAWQGLSNKAPGIPPVTSDIGSIIVTAEYPCTAESDIRCASPTGHHIGDGIALKRKIDCSLDCGNVSGMHGEYPKMTATKRCWAVPTRSRLLFDGLTLNSKKPLRQMR